MRSIAGTSSIVATIITLLVAANGKVVGREAHRTIRCVAGKQIRATPRAKQLGVAGKVCKKRIIVRKRPRRPKRPLFVG